MSNDLISRSALIIALAEDADVLKHAKELIRLKVEEAPTVDSVPVVRCRECMYGENRIAIIKPHSQYITCKNDKSPTNHRSFDCDDFCSYGVRKEPN